MALSELDSLKKNPPPTPKWPPYPNYGGFAYNRVQDEPSTAGMDARGPFAGRHLDCSRADGMAEYENAERANRIAAAEFGSVRAEIESVRAQVESVRAELRSEMKALEERIGRQLAERELRLSQQIMELGRRVERLEEARGLVRP